jgi:nucleoside-diphosphate-sugar epimerase
LGSVKAMGDAAAAGIAPADESTPPAPDTLYGRAKLEAEHLVLRVGVESHLHACVLRLPMVYGLEGAGNIARMIDAVARNRFPPWPRIENRRSAVHVDDAVRAAMLAACHPSADGQVYLVTDGENYSTRWLYERIRIALWRPVPGWTLPLWTLRFAAGIGSAAEHFTGRAVPLTRTGLGKLTGDAWYSSEKIRRELGFEPRHRLAEEIPRLVDAYLARRAKGNGRVSVAGTDEEAAD